MEKQKKSAFILTSIKMLKKNLNQNANQFPLFCVMNCVLGTCNFKDNVETNKIYLFTHDKQMEFQRTFSKL